MKRTHGDYEIPGFYVEPQTGRYFQVPVNGSPLPRLFNGSRVEPASADNNRRRRRILYEPKLPRFRSILNCLSSNQLGSVDSLKYQHEVSALRLQNLSVKHEFVYPFENKDLKIRFLRGGSKFLYGQWGTPKKGTYFYALDDFAKFGHPSARDAACYEISYVGPQIVVSDMCEGYSHRMCMLYVGNDYNSGLGTARLTWHREFTNDASETSRHFYVNSAVWCCCSNSYLGLFALGIENGVYIHDYRSHLYTKRFKGQVLGIDYKKDTDVIYAGINHGRLVTIDTRINNRVSKIKLNDYALTEIVLQENDNYMICAGLGNFLSQVDLRMQRNVVRYLGENRETLKNPVSVNETHNLLCSTGSDEVTRIWSLRGGSPLKTIPPPFPGEACRAWLKAESASKMSIYLASRNVVFIYEC